jgi:hypothetical protein
MATIGNSARATRINCRFLEAMWSIDPGYGAKKRRTAVYHTARRRLCVQLLAIA